MPVEAVLPNSHLEAQPAPVGLLRWLQQLDEQTALPVREWAALANAADAHGLAPLLWERLAALGVEPPPEVAEALRRESLAVAAKNLALAAELRHILQALHTAGIPCVPIRGLALGERLYGRIGLRPTGDLDLLVRREHLEPLGDVLLRKGFSNVEPRPGFAIRFDYAQEFFKFAPDRIIAEPRWSLCYPPFVDRIAMEPVWNRAKPGACLGIPCWELATEDDVLHLALHIVHHRQAAPGLWLYELEQHIRRPDFRWPVLVDTARDAGVGWLVYSALRHLQRSMDCTLPDEALQGLVRGIPQHPADRLLTETRVHNAERLATIIYGDSFSERLIFAREFLVPSPRFLREQYGVSGWRLAWTYIARPARMVGMGVAGLWRWLLRLLP